MRKGTYICILTAVFAAVLFCVPVLGTEGLDPCELFSQSDAEALFKEPVSPGVLRDSVTPAGKSCRYSFKKNGSVFGISVRVCTTAEIASEGIYASAEDVFVRQVSARTSHEEASKTFQEVGVPGGEAFWGGTDLWVLKGNVLFLVTVHAPLEGVFKDMDEMDTALEKKNLDLSRHAAGVILGRLQ